MVRRRGRALTPAGRAVAGVLALLAVAAGLRVVVALPERCPPVSAGELRGAIAEAAGWFERNQRGDGRWLYRYDATADVDVGGYNVVRHAGVTLSLYQAASAGVDGALATADRGARYALQRLVREGDRAAFEPTRGWVRTGATALLVAALTERRTLVGDVVHDDALKAMGRFLAAQVEPSGAVSRYWDPGTRRRVPGAYSRFFTGQTYWALARLHRHFPGEGWDETVRRIGAYLATRRDDAEGHFPDVPDHWAAYGLAEVVTGTDAAGLAPHDVRFARRQAGLAGIQVRWESQRTDHWPNWWLRGHRTLGAGLGTVGEQLSQLWAVAGEDRRLADLRAPLEARVLCTAGMLVGRQVQPEEARAAGSPERVRGAWFASGVTQMDDQQHAMSALLGALPIAAQVGGGPVDRTDGPRPTAWLLLVAIVAAVNPARVASGVRRQRRPGRRAVVALGGVVAVSALTLVAATADSVLGWLAVSEPTARIGAGLVLVLAAVVDLLTRPPRSEPALDGVAGALVPIAVPLLLRPSVVVVAFTAGADRGSLFVFGAGAVAALAVVVMAGDVASGETSPGGAIRRWLARVTAACLAVAAVALVIDGIYDV